ncbi:hypothetical protein LR48_Vigan04g145700 [Vigna angularis]|uniref:Uncharacterized protein n=1 Tax=Phaseolus angularis TaxID=3914 RepID=A0A0L9UFD5_PHAAN|nr:hypothetical protein LR48_Vigan04g145700 [Vigna angularis]
MKDDYYPNLVDVFYNNLKVVNGDIHSRVKGVDIMINNDTWLQVARLKDEGCMSHLLDSFNKWTKKRKMYKDCMRYPGRYKKEKGFLHGGLDKEEKVIAYITDWLLLPGRETKVICNKTNEIGKAILTCIGLKKTAMGWIFSDEQIQVKNNDEVFDSDEEQVSFSLKSKFEKFVVKRFEKISKKANKMKKIVMSMEVKMNEIIKIYMETTTSTEESTDEDDESSKEDSMEISELE